MGATTSFIPQTKTLDLSNQNLEKISSKQNKYKDVVNVHLQKNRIRSIPKNISSVYTINLSENQLEIIPSKMAKCLATYPKLVMLDLSSNCMIKFPNELQDTNLEQLSLFANKLCEIKLKFKKLKIINLGQNRFQVMPIFPKCITNINMDFNFLKKVKLNYDNLAKLYLNLNNIEEFDPSSFLPSLIFLNLSRNKLKSLPDISKICPSLQMFECSDNFLTEFPKLPSGIVEVVLRNNKIKSLPVFASDYPNIKCIELDENEISFLPPLPKNIMFLSIVNNKLEGISPSETPALKKCTLEKNYLQKVPQFIKNSLEEISLKYNQIKTMKGFIYSENMSFIDLSSNKIEIIDPELFKLPNLKVLMLCNNNIKNIPPEFSHAKALSNFNISMNPLEQFTIPVPMSLKKLFVSYCKLQNLPSNISNSNIEELVISGNQIQNIGFIPKLKKLYASENFFCTFPKLSKSINIIDLSLNQINELKDDIDYPDLTDIDLSFNEIVSLPMLGLPNLRYLNLGNNTNLKTDIIFSKENFPSLSTLVVYNTKIKFNSPPNIRELFTNQYELFQSPYVKLIQMNNSTGFSELRGVRENMEDSIIVREFIKDDLSLYAVFDGHGGAKTSTMAAYRFAKFTAEHGELKKSFLCKCLERCNEIIKKSNFRWFISCNYNER